MTMYSQFFHTSTLLFAFAAGLVTQILMFQAHTTCTTYRKIFAKIFLGEATSSIPHLIGTSENFPRLSSIPQLITTSENFPRLSSIPQLITTSENFPKLSSIPQLITTSENFPELSSIPQLKLSYINNATANPPVPLKTFPRLRHIINAAANRSLPRLRHINNATANPPVHLKTFPRLRHINNTELTV